MVLLVNLLRQRVLVGLFFVTVFTLEVVSLQAQQQQHGIRIVKNEASRRVDVFVDEQLFTSYVWPEMLKTPVLFPLRTAKGTVVTRGFPLEPRPGERVDHPHHAGFWLNYGNVNGVDFWNNSTVVSATRQATMGTVLHRRINKATSGADKGELEVETDWI